MTDPIDRDMVATMPTPNELQTRPKISFSRPETELRDDLDDELERAFDLIELPEHVTPSNEERNEWADVPVVSPPDGFLYAAPRD